jgi:ElaB/YqjD/DUF883 family membrane-anchored ribosome-binding protein
MAEHHDHDREAIRADIEETRARMSHRIDELGERLNPDHLKSQLKDSVRDATIGRAERMAHDVGDTVTETGHTLWDTIKENPIPAAMVGLGIGWLIANRSHGPERDLRARRRAYARDYGFGADYGYGRDYYGGYAGTLGGGERGVYGGEGGYYGYAREEERGAPERVRERVEEVSERVRERATEVSDRAQELAGEVSGRARRVAHEAGERVSELADTAQGQARRLEHRVEHMVQDSPLAAGAAALAIGLAAGMAIPETEKEDELLGPARDRLVERAQGTAREVGEKVQRVAGAAASSARDTAERAADREGLTR